MAVASVSRICAYNGCTSSLDGMRSQARYCSTAHRSAAYREEPFKTVSTASRGASRDGKGAKVYLQPEEIDALVFLSGYIKAYGGGPYVELRRKLEAAQEKAALRRVVSGGPPNLNSR